MTADNAGYDKHRPRLLDLFCGAGGAAVGYHRAGFDVVGVDIKPQPHYPFEFHQGDALEVLADLDGWADDLPMPVAPFWDRRRFDAIHVSPPCQAYSVATPDKSRCPDLLPQTRRLLEQTGLPWVIENVPGAPMRADYVLCGCMFGLDVERRRWFETSWHGFSMRPPCNGHEVIPVFGGGDAGSNTQRRRRRLGLPPISIEDKRRAMGIDWMTRDELSQAIPPAYTEWVGRAAARNV